jgi:hypothetical protein
MNRVRLTALQPLVSNYHGKENMSPYKVRRQSRLTLYLFVLIVLLPVDWETICHQDTRNHSIAVRVFQLLFRG